MNEAMKNLINPIKEESATEQSLFALNDYVQKKFGVALPADYIELLRYTNGAEGPIGEEGYLVLWDTESLLARNDNYPNQDQTAGMFLFGGDGGNTAYGIDMRTENPNEPRYIETDLVGIGWDAIFFHCNAISILLQYVSVHKT